MLYYISLLCFDICLKFRTAIYFNGRTDEYIWIVRSSALTSLLTKLGKLRDVIRSRLQLALPPNKDPRMRLSSINSNTK